MSYLIYPHLADCQSVKSICVLLSLFSGLNNCFRQVSELLTGFGRRGVTICNNLKPKNDKILWTSAASVTRICPQHKCRGAGQPQLCVLQPKSGCLPQTRHAHSGKGHYGSERTGHGKTGTSGNASSTEVQNFLTIGIQKGWAMGQLWGSMNSAFSMLANLRRLTYVMTLIQPHNAPYPTS